MAEFTLLAEPAPERFAGHVARYFAATRPAILLAIFVVSMMAIAAILVQDARLPVILSWESI